MANSDRIESLTLSLSKARTERNNAMIALAELQAVEELVTDQLISPKEALSRAKAILQRYHLSIDTAQSKAFDGYIQQARTGLNAMPAGEVQYDTSRP